jgi:hypothetical protein
VVSFTPRPVYNRRKSSRYLLYRRLGGLQSRSGRRGEEKTLNPTGTRTDPSVVQLVASPYTDCSIPAPKKRSVYRILVKKPKAKTPLGRPRRRWVDNTEMDLTEIGWGGMGWINLTQERNKCRALVKTAMNLRIS